MASLIRRRSEPPGPVRTLPTQPSRATQVSPKKNSDSPGAASIALATPPVSRPVAKSAVYVAHHTARHAIMPLPLD